MGRMRRSERRQGGSNPSPGATPADGSLANPAACKADALCACQGQHLAGRFLEGRRIQVRRAGLLNRSGATRWSSSLPPSARSWRGPKTASDPPEPAASAACGCQAPPSATHGEPAVPKTAAAARGPGFETPLQFEAQGGRLTGTSGLQTATVGSTPTARRRHGTRGARAVRNR